MLLEASTLGGGDVVDIHGIRLGRVDKLVFTAKVPALFGVQVASGAVVNRFRALPLSETIALERQRLVVEDSKALSQNMKELDAVFAECGSVIGVAAFTESGQNIGTVSDVLLDADTGLIVRFYIRTFLKERLIPTQYLVSLTPKRIVFEDVVMAPTFAQIATSEQQPIA